VRSRLSRARSTLRELLGDPGQYLNGTAESSQPAVMTEDTP
jgi:hypothetical protein